MEDVITVSNLVHTFGRGEACVRVLHGVDLTVRRGEVVILSGPSGSGKTTLLTLIGCLRSVEAGSVRVLGTELAGATPETLTEVRRRLGFIFQAHNLHNSLTAFENVSMGLAVHGPAVFADATAACARALELVGMGDRLDFLPEKLSGGQKQRVAVARALVGNPEIVFADEPTAALDRENGRRVVELLRRLADHRGTTVVMVTHDHRVMDVADRVIAMEEGHIVERPRAA